MSRTRAVVIGIVLAATFYVATALLLPPVETVTGTELIDGPDQLQPVARRSPKTGYLPPSK